LDEQCVSEVVLATLLLPNSGRIDLLDNGAIRMYAHGRIVVKTIDSWIAMALQQPVSAGGDGNG
jgi:hypothetical protein